MKRKSQSANAESKPSKKQTNQVDQQDKPDANAESSDTCLVNAKRVRTLKAGTYTSGAVVYWMSREQRMHDNWALLYAAQQAASKQSGILVAFNLVTSFLGAGARQFCFMLKGLQELEQKLAAHGIPFYLLQGDPVETIPQLVREVGAGMLVTDYSPLRLGREWRQKVCEAVDIPVHEVDAHNVVPVWEASNKREYAARTIRPKIHRQLPEFLLDFPMLPEGIGWLGDGQDSRPEIDWKGLIQLAKVRGVEVPEVDWLEPGEDAAQAALSKFLSPSVLGKYHSSRNDPSSTDGLSNLSPYLHFGQLAPQRAALEAQRLHKKHRDGVNAYIEELVVRRELADNFCEYTPNYDSVDCAPDWARLSLEKHSKDQREHVYSRQQLEKAETHDDLWNAAQLELVRRGKMHGYLRMYWAKKILQWTSTPQEAAAEGIYLNDKYSLDGRDPAGYTGVMWSVAGVHDRAWAERAVFGKVRYMSYDGCKGKFSIPSYIAHVNRLPRVPL